MSVDVPLGTCLAGECGFTLEVVVGTEGGGVGIFEGSRLYCRFLLFYNPQTPFQGGFGRCAPITPGAQINIRVAFGAPGSAH